MSELPNNQSPQSKYYYSDHNKFKEESPPPPAPTGLAEKVDDAGRTVKRNTRKRPLTPAQKKQEAQTPPKIEPDYTNHSRWGSWRQTAPEDANSMEPNVKKEQTYIANNQPPDPDDEKEPPVARLPHDKVNKKKAPPPTKKRPRSIATNRAPDSEDEADRALDHALRLQARGKPSKKKVSILITDAIDCRCQGERRDDEMVLCDDEECRWGWFHEECAEIEEDHKGLWICGWCEVRRGVEERDFLGR